MERGKQREREKEEWKVVMEDSNILQNVFGCTIFRKIPSFLLHFTLCYHPPEILFSNRVFPMKLREMWGGYKGHRIELRKRTSSTFISTSLILVHRIYYHILPAMIYIYIFFPTILNISRVDKTQETKGSCCSEIYDNKIHPNIM